MDHPEQNPQQQYQQDQPVMGMVAGTNHHMPYPNPYQSPPLMASGAPASSPAQPSTNFAYQQAQQFHLQQQQQQQQQLQLFWADQMNEIEHTTDFKNHTLPLARIKKIMKADEDVRMISAEAPVIFAKACEMFILELTLRSWIHTEENKRRTLQKNDIAAAISRTDVFDFLVDIIPRDELKEEGLGVTKSSIPLMGSPADHMPYYYVPPVGPGGMVMGTQQAPPPVAFLPWPQSQPPMTQQQQQQQLQGQEKSGS